MRLTKPYGFIFIISTIPAGSTSAPYSQENAFTHIHIPCSLLHTPWFFFPCVTHKSADTFKRHPQDCGMCVSVSVCARQRGCIAVRCIIDSPTLPGHVIPTGHVDFPHLIYTDFLIGRIKFMCMSVCV